MRRRLPASLWIPAAVLLLVAAVTLVRALDALREGDLRTTPAERTLYEWAAGDRRLDERLAAAAPALPPGVGVRLVVPAGTEEGWATFHGLYHLPQQHLLGIHRADAPPPPADAWIVDITGPVPSITPPRGAAAPQRP